MAENNTVNLSGDIGLTLSGGGYRAAAFHLGTMDYLQQIGMLDQVKMLSTVSGGTFTGAKWALSQAQNKSYNSFYDDYYQFLATTDLLSLGLDQLSEGENQAPSQRQDMIVSMAQVYADTFLSKKNGEPYRFGEILNAEMNLREISFNATEFKHGLAFRFQRSENPKAYIGNQRIHISKEDAENVRMADIVAASSCFPGGFEPFAFPNDFVWPDKTIPESLQAQFSDGPLALMDGGVYDNQGLQSLLLADERSANDLDMFIISDVDQKSDNLFPFPKIEVNNKKGLSLETLAKLSIVFIGLLFISMIMMLYKLFTEDTGFIDFFFLGVIPVALVVTAIYTLVLVRKKTKKLLDMVPLVGRAAWKDIKHLTTDELIEMISLRVASLFAMAGSIFMKRIRSLVYGLIYGDFRPTVRKAVNELYAGKRISNLIYHLEAGEPFNKQLIKAGVSETSTNLTKITTRASRMSTTLWFENEQQLEDLIITGRATTCYNLMKYLVRNYGIEPEKFPQQASQLWQRLVKDWDKFNADA